MYVCMNVDSCMRPIRMYICMNKYQYGMYVCMNIDSCMRPLCMYI